MLGQEHNENEIFLQLSPNLDQSPRSSLLFGLTGLSVSTAFYNFTRNNTSNPLVYDSGAATMLARGYDQQLVIHAQTSRKEETAKQLCVFVETASDLVKLEHVEDAIAKNTQYTINRQGEYNFSYIIDHFVRYGTVLNTAEHRETLQSIKPEDILQNTARIINNSNVNGSYIAYDGDGEDAQKAHQLLVNRFG